MHRRTIRFTAPLAAIALAALVASCSKDSSSTPTSTAATADITKVGHVVVIYLENHSFDNLYGEYAGAEGLAGAATAAKQISATGAAYASLPEVNGSPIPTSLTNSPFNIDQYVPATVATRDLVHRYYQEQQQIDGGKMDKFVSLSDNPGLVMSGYDATTLPEGQFAQQYVVCDNFFTLCRLPSVSSQLRD